MNTVIASCLEVLKRRRDLLADAIACLSAVAELDGGTPPAKSVTLDEVQEHFRARRVAAAKPAQLPVKPVPAKQSARPTKATCAAKKVRPAAKRAGWDAVMGFLLNAKEPVRSVAIAEALKLSYSVVNRTLVQLEQRKHVVRTGSHIHTRWSLPPHTQWSLPPLKAGEAKPVNGTKTVKAEGVEFEVVFDGSRGQAPGEKR